MDGKKNGNGNGPDGESTPSAQSPKSILIIEFAEMGSALFNSRIENVTPAQIMAAAGWLQWLAEKQFDRQMKAQEQAHIVVPNLKL